MAANHSFSPIADVTAVDVTTGRIIGARVGKVSKKRLYRLFEVAGHLVAEQRFEPYRDVEALTKTLLRRFKSFDEQDAIAAVNRAARLYDAAVTVAEQNKSALWPAVRDGLALKMPKKLRIEMLNKMRLLAPGESDADYEKWLGWVFYVWHIR